MIERFGVAGTLKLTLASHLDKYLCPLGQD